MTAAEVENSPPRCKIVNDSGARAVVHDRESPVFRIMPSLKSQTSQQNFRDSIEDGNLNDSRDEANVGHLDSP